MSDNYSEAMHRIINATNNDRLNHQVDEWSTADDPFIVWWQPITLKVKSRIQKAAKDNDQASSVYTIIFMAENIEGEKLFTLADKGYLMANIASKPLEDLALRMLNVIAADAEK